MFTGIVKAKGRVRSQKKQGRDLRGPGAYELPPAVNKVASQHRCDGIVALGAVIRGATPHFDCVAGDCTSGVAATSRQHGMPIGIGVLTTDTIEQAIERAGTKVW